jgi:hypothetical protein
MSLTESGSVAMVAALTAISLVMRISAPSARSPASVGALSSWTTRSATASSLAMRMRPSKSSRPPLRKTVLGRGAGGMLLAFARAAVRRPSHTAARRIDGRVPPRMVLVGSLRRRRCTVALGALGAT